MIPHLDVRAAIRELATLAGSAIVITIVVLVLAYGAGVVLGTVAAGFRAMCGC